jgi:segregation and condensation protein B
VNSDKALNRLVEYGLVIESGRQNVPGRPLLFATSEEFLRRFGVDEFAELDIVRGKIQSDL